MPILIEIADKAENKLREDLVSSLVAMRARIPLNRILEALRIGGVPAAMAL